FVDHVPLEQIPTCLADTDICMLPSLWDNFPNACLEAMSAARGIVASRAGGMVDMLEDVNAGMLVEPNNARQLAQAINTLLADPARRQAMAARAREKIVNYYAREVGDMTERYYQAAIDEPQAKREDPAS